MIQSPFFVDGSMPWKEQERERRQNFLLLFHEKQNKQKALNGRNIYCIHTRVTRVHIALGVKVLRKNRTIKSWGWLAKMLVLYNISKVMF